MKNLKQSLTKPSEIPVNKKKFSKWLIIAIALISFIGFIDSAYLTVEHYTGASLKCYIVSGCDTVLTSKYSSIGPVPVALLGAIYYVIIFLSLFLYFDIKKESIIFNISKFTAVGFLMSAWFLYLQIFVIKAICFYCLISATTSTLLFILGMIIVFKKRT